MTYIAIGMIWGVWWMISNISPDHYGFLEDFESFLGLLFLGLIHGICWPISMVIFIFSILLDR